MQVSPFCRCFFCSKGNGKENLHFSLIIWETDMKKIFAALLLAPSLLAAKPITDNEAQLDKAVRQFAATYQQSGLQGAIQEIQSCYANAQADKLYCMYLDTAARIVDIKAAASYHFPTDAYFSDDAYSERVIKMVYLPRRATREEALQHMDALFRRTDEKLTENGIFQNR